MGSRFRRNGFIFFEQRPITAQGLLEKQPQGIKHHRERGLGGVLAMAVQQVVMDLLLGQFLRGTPVVPHQTLDGEQIPLLGRPPHAGQLHIRHELALQGVAGCRIGDGIGTLLGGTAFGHGRLLKT